jgi:hypothetical protein
MGGCGKDGFVRDYATTMRGDVLFKLHSSFVAALVCFGNDCSQSVVFGM